MYLLVRFTYSTMTNLFSKLAAIFDEEEDARTCKDISEESCKVVSGNFWLILFSQFFSKLADALASAKIVLPWLMTSIGAPVFLSGLLVPIRESGSLIPQLFIGGYIRSFALRKTFFVIGGVIQALSVLAMTWVVLNLSAMLGGLAIVGLLSVFSLARGLCSIASKDVLGKTIAKQDRGSLSGYAATAAGLIGMLVGLVLMLDIKLQDILPWLLLSAAIFWLISALFYQAIKEFKGETEGGSNGFLQALKSLRLLKDEITFRQFVLTRSLMMSSGLSAPYFIILAQSHQPADQYSNLGLFIVISGLASFVSAAVWGKLADHSSRWVILITAILVTLLCLAGSIISMLNLSDNTPWVMALFFVLAVTHQGVRLGRKTYLVNMAQGNQRTTYVAVSNTLIGFLLLVIGLVSAGLAYFSLAAVFAVFALSSASALYIGWNMAEV
ncbi:MFS transporter [Paraglaciecola sp. 25GB23A]|uniref:MFS transporter n=1 Tax=Paraglaciecola sp. 25GB23A TaxID=3156068 RepID=UPI0032AFB118